MKPSGAGRRRLCYGLLVGLAALPAVSARVLAQLADEPVFLFVEVAAQAGLRVPTWCGRPDKPHLLESGGTGLALFDYDNDGDLDLYLVNGWRLEGEQVVERGRNLLYRNRGDGTFDDVTEAAGVGDDGWGTAVTVADIDGDLDQDLFVTNFGPDVLYRNQGDGRFRVESEPPGIVGWSASPVFFDADHDGDMDLFVAGYVDVTMAEVLGAERTLNWKGAAVMSGPFGLEGLANRFFVNDGRGVFSDATAAAGLTDVGLYYSFGAAALDLDGDRLIDLYVANDSNPNYLYANRGAGVFDEVGLWSGAALDINGAAQAGMGVASGDYDADGLPDLFVTNFAQDTSTLYRNLGNFAFEDVSVPLGVRDATYAPLSWGTVFADMDLDGDLDLFVANGHIYPQADSNPAAATSYAQRDLLLAQEEGRFVDRSSESGPGLEHRASSRGVAVGDIDNDGDLDLVVSNIDAPPSLLRNDSQRRGNWLIIDAPGALAIEVEASGTVFRRHYVAGGSFASAADPRYHFGLGSVTSIERLRVLWQDGNETLLEAPAVNQILRVER